MTNKPNAPLLEYWPGGQACKPNVYGRQELFADQVTVRTGAANGKRTRLHVCSSGGGGGGDGDMAYYT